MKLHKLVLSLIHTNCYILENEKTHDCVIIDIAYVRDQVPDYIARHNLNVCAVLITHGHFDHCGGVALVTDGKNIPIYCAKEDEFFANNASKNSWHARAYDCAVTNYVADGDVLHLAGFEIQVLSTPGHTPGSVCYLVDDMMFSGDTLFYGDIGSTEYPGGDDDEQIASLRRLVSIEKDYKVYPGHGDETTLSAEKRNNPYLQNL